MKKILVLLIVLSISRLSSTAQWTQSTTTPGAYFLTSGSAAIGTTTFNQKLTVNGAIVASGTATALSPNGAYIDYCASCCASRFFSTGPNTSTLGVIKFANVNSDATGYLESMTILGSGNVGIGTTAPAELLTVGVEDGMNSSARKAIYIASGGYAQPSAFNTPSNGDKVVLYNSPTASYDGRIGVGTYGNLWFKSIGNSGASPTGIVEWYTGSSTSPKMVLSANGALSIGTSDPKSYMLAVNGGIIATAVTVKLYSSWSDYVFDRQYSLMPLSHLKTYIDINHHLPEIPSSKEIERDGINVAQMNGVLVKKVEELTLYLLEKDKQLQEQNNRLTVQDLQLAEMNKQIKIIKAQLNIH